MIGGTPVGRMARMQAWHQELAAVQPPAAGAEVESPRLSEERFGELMHQAEMAGGEGTEPTFGMGMSEQDRVLLQRELALRGVGGSDALSYPINPQDVPAGPQTDVAALFSMMPREVKQRGLDLPQEEQDLRTTNRDYVARFPEAGLLASEMRTQFGTWDYGDSDVIPQYELKDYARLDLREWFQEKTGVELRISNAIDNSLAFKIVENALSTAGAPGSPLNNLPPGSIFLAGHSGYGLHSIVGREPLPNDPDSSWRDMTLLADPKARQEFSIRHLQ
jgi:hypothetical protein